MKNKLIERAEDFIIEHDINANIIKDGKIKQGAKLLAEFTEAYYQDGIRDELIDFHAYCQKNISMLYKSRITDEEIVAEYLKSKQP